jgi:hypothetical protein
MYFVGIHAQIVFRTRNSLDNVLSSDVCFIGLQFPERCCGRSSRQIHIHNCISTNRAGLLDSSQRLTIGEALSTGLNLLVEFSESTHAGHNRDYNCQCCSCCPDVSSIQQALLANPSIGFAFLGYAAWITKHFSVSNGYIGENNSF